jgi:hypothetical protein
LHPVLGSFHKEDIVLRDHVVGSGIQIPIAPAPRGDYPDPDLDRQRQFAQALADCRRSLSNFDAGNDLIRVSEVFTKVIEESEPRRNDVGDVLSRIGDLLNRRRDLEYARHVFRIFGASCREDRELAKISKVDEHPIFETSDLFGKIRVGKEDGRVREIDHELRRVLDLRQELLDGTSTFSLVTHLISLQATPNTTSAITRQITPSRSIPLVTRGMVWLSGSNPNR